ncbi:hypothetical protein INS49_000079 [Diaporthe citri]|uniref:uncharacterized protein n=1 Tax=Diaporthe citri TaxID=83186 RepID=UPI001C804120|nr:uncharacterized protein INS49_000079 [Diaporthe citri]KAG6365903.1 hypothetical protein INS49_000079 [Diaporthe citri]
MERIDVHHHFIPEAYIEAFHAGGGDASGWTLPSWSPQASIDLMQSHQTSTAILSLTAPGPMVLRTDLKAASALCREINECAASLCKERPTRFGFFSTLPPVVDGNMDAVLEEVAYSLDILKADGVTLFTRYGSRYLGHKALRPLWEALEKRRAVVFVHPTHSANTDLVSPALPQPVIDYPHETTRAAVDLITSNTVRDHPNVKIILSHAGGTLPYLATRAAHLLADAHLSAQSPDEILDQARSFYFDLALSGNPSTLELILTFAKPGHVLYGSDFPYAPTKTINSYVEMLDAHLRTIDDETAYSIARGAAIRLFPRFRTAADDRDNTN